MEDFIRSNRFKRTLGHLIFRMKQAIAIVAIISVFGVSNVYAAGPEVTLLGTPSTDVLTHSTNDDFGFCNEVVFTFPVLVTAGDDAVKVTDVALNVQNEEGEIVAENVVSGFPVAFEATNAVVDVPCASFWRPELWYDNLVVPAGTSDDFNVVAYFTPEEAGTFDAFVTAFEFGTPEDETTIATRRVAASGPCLNCDVTSEEDDEDFLGTGEEVDIDGMVIVQFVKLLIDLGILILE